MPSITSRKGPVRFDPTARVFLDLIVMEMTTVPHAPSRSGPVIRHIGRLL
jgi:hypothetical protein